MIEMDLIRGLDFEMSHTPRTWWLTIVAIELLLIPVAAQDDVLTLNCPSGYTYRRSCQYQSRCFGRRKAQGILNGVRRQGRLIAHIAMHVARPAGGVDIYEVMHLKEIVLTRYQSHKAMHESRGLSVQVNRQRARRKIEV